MSAIPVLEMSREADLSLAGLADLGSSRKNDSLSNQLGGNKGG